MSSSYPTPDEIRAMFHPMSQQGQQSQFLEKYVAEDVNWTIAGHCPMQGVVFLLSVRSVVGVDVICIVHKPIRLRGQNLESTGQRGPDGATQDRRRPCQWWWAGVAVGRC